MPTLRDLEVSDPILLLKRISDEFPDVTWNTYTFIEHGWDHQVIILDNKLVFRFPNSSEYLAAFTFEADFLDLIRTKCTTTIPNYHYVAKDRSFGGYKMIAGTELMKSVFITLSEAQQSSVESQIAEFLTAMHTIPAEEVKPFRVSPERYMDDYPLLKENVAAYLPARLTETEYALVQEIIKEVENVVANQPSTVLIHGDFANKHILWDKDSEKIGVIDFSDRLLGDPALDFAELHLYGSTVVKNIYALYSGPKDDLFLKRAKTYFKRIGIFLMVDAFTNNKVTFEFAKNYFDMSINI